MSAVNSENVEKNSIFVSKRIPQFAKFVMRKVFCYDIFVIIFSLTKHIQYRPNALILKNFINKISDHKGRVFFSNEPQILIREVGYCVIENIGYIKNI